MNPTQTHKLQMIEETVKRGLGQFSSSGALMVQTGKHTGRATKEKFFVDRPETHGVVDWGTVNQPLDFETSKKIFANLAAKIEGAPHYSCNRFVGPFSIRVRSFSPWHVVFAENMFRSEMSDAFSTMAQSQSTSAKIIEVLHDPFGKVSDLGVQLPTETVILLDPVELKIAIIGTAYAGEIKKGAFTLCNYQLPEMGIFPMHASANCKENGQDACVLFGLSGTGKTTLSASSDRLLIGDDEILWSSSGLSNLEGGCYAKLIDLSAEKEPEIFAAVNQFGSIMENVVCEKDGREVNYNDSTRTENTRGSYPIHALRSVYNQKKEATPPKNIVFLTADAFGAMPAVARLDNWQAQYHFISGYTAKVAGTELGVKEPTAAFSTCFGAPFMPRHASEYAKLLKSFLEKNPCKVWILNTGWTNGGYGKGPRFPIAVSRALLSAIQDGTMDQQTMSKHSIFGFEVPTTCPGVNAEYLKTPTGPAVEELAKKFMNNMKKFQDKLDPNVTLAGGPKL